LKLFNDMMAFPDDGTFKFSRFGADCVEAWAWKGVASLRDSLAAAADLSSVSRRGLQKDTQVPSEGSGHALRRELLALRATPLPQDDSGLVEHGISADET
jgi:hypothetical protein